jgi:hypothetical protein
MGDILPGTAGLQHTEDAVERLAIRVALPAWAGFLLRDQGLDDGPLRICNVMSAHTPSLAWGYPILKWLVVIDSVCQKR